jgi:hypothetical protein
MHPFRFGIQVSELPFDGWRERVRWYEELGFTTISTPDHYIMRQWDPVSLMGAVAGVTRSAAVGSTVLNVGLRQPIDLARMAATVAQQAAWVRAGDRAQHAALLHGGRGRSGAAPGGGGGMDRRGGGGAGAVDDLPGRHAG